MKTHSICLGLFLCSSAFVLAGATCIWTGGAGDGLWSSGGNWSTGVEPAAGDEVTISGGAIVTLTNQTAALASFTLDGATLTFREPTRCPVADAVAELRATTVSLVNGAKMSHVEQTYAVQEWIADGKGDWKIDGRVFVTCTDLSIDAASSINVCGLGYTGKYATSTAANGPCVFSTPTWGSPGHGGNGASALPNSSDWAHPTLGVYDDPVHPVLPGSGGSHGNSGTDYGIAGGGVVRIAASGAVTVAGTIDACAQSAGGSQRGGGSGGSVWITAKTVSGSGSILAFGRSNTAEKTPGRCGGGGCVALHYDPTEQAKLAVPTLKLNVGVSGRPNERSEGDVGTLYLSDTRFLGDTFSDQQGIVMANLVLGDWSGWSPTSLTLNGAWLRLPASVCNGLNLTGGIAVSGLYGRLDLGGDLLDFRQAGTSPVRASETIDLTVGGNVTVSDKGRLHLYAAVTNGTAETYARLKVNGDLSLATGAVFELYAHPSNGAACRVECQNLTVDATSTLTASARGFGGAIQGTSSKRGFGPGGGGHNAGGSHGGFSSGGASLRRRTEAADARLGGRLGQQRERYRRCGRRTRLGGGERNVHPQRNGLGRWLWYAREQHRRRRGRQRLSAGEPVLGLGQRDGERRLV